jgi:cell division protein ZapA
LTTVEESHRIRVLGREIQVRTSASQETVREVEEFVNSRAAEVAAQVRNADSQVVAVLTLMNIAEAYLAQSRELASCRELSADRLPGLLKRIDQRLG